MYNLILKDFLIQKKTLLYGFLYIIFAAFAFKELVSNDGAMYVIGPFAVIYLFVNYSSGFDDKSKANIIFNSLPIKREDVVIAKYASIVFFALFGIVCSMLVGAVGFYTGIMKVSRLITIKDVILTLAGGGIFAAIFYPFYFKLGTDKMKYANIFLFMAFMFLPSYLVGYAERHPNSEVVKRVISMFFNTPAWKLNMLLAIVACIIVLTSLLVSIHIYKNKDF